MPYCLLLTFPVIPNLCMCCLYTYVYPCGVRCVCILMLQVNVSHPFHNEETEIQSSKKNVSRAIHLESWDLKLGLLIFKNH